MNLNLFCGDYNDGLIDVACLEKIGDTEHMKTLIYNGRNDIDWNNYGASVEKYDHFACRYFIHIFQKINFETPTFKIISPKPHGPDLWDQDRDSVIIHFLNFI